MSRHLFGLPALFALLVAGGCAMCESPFDYCGPTFRGPKGPGGDPCFFLERAGSIFAPAPVSTPASITGQGQMAAPSENAIEEAAPNSSVPGELPTNGAGQAPGIAPQPDAGANAMPLPRARTEGVAGAFRR